MARAPLREPLAVVRQGLVVQVVYAGVAAAAAAVAGQRPLRRHRARVAGVGRPRRTGRGRGRDRHAAMVARTVVTVQTFRAARSGPRHVESAPNVNRGTCASMPSALGTHRAMRAWRRLALVVLACAGLLPATPSRALDPEMRAAHYTVTRWSADDGLPHSQIHDIGQDPDGFLWVATWEGTARFDGLGFTPVRGLHEAAGGRLASRLVWRDDDGSMLVAIDGPGLLRASSDRAPGPACAGTAELPVARIAAAAGGGAWLAAAEGLYRLRPGGRCERVPGGESLAGRAVNALLAQDDGSLWLGLP